MGTRADFFIEYKNNDFEYIGSIGWDGHISNFQKECKINGIKRWKKTIRKMIIENEGTLPEYGYPFPWADDIGKCETVYVFREIYKKVYVFRRSHIGAKGENCSIGYYVDPLIDFYVTLPSFGEFDGYTRDTKRSGMILGLGGGILDIKDEGKDNFTLPIKVLYCDICNNHKDPDCKCDKYFGDELFGEELETIQEIFQFNEKNLDFKKDEDIAWNYDSNYTYKCFWRKKNGKIRVFRKEITKDQYDQNERSFKQYP
jgi:hypothetical protein